MATVSVQVGLIKVVISDPNIKTETLADVAMGMIEKTVNLVKEADIPETKYHFNPHGPGDDIDPNGNITARA